MIIPIGRTCVITMIYGQKPDDDGVSLLDKILRKLVEMERQENERCPHTTMIIVDSKSIQNADIAESKGYDAGKNFWNKTAYWCGCSWNASCDYDYHC